MIGELSGLGCAAAWAVISVTMRSVSNRTSPVVVNALRCSFAAATLLIVVFVLGKAGNLSDAPLRSIGLILLSGLLGQAGGDALFVISMKMIGASRAMPVSSINPMLTLALAMLLLGERMTALGILGAVMVLAGIYMVAFPYGLARAREMFGSADRKGLALALGTAFLWSVSSIILKMGLSDIDLVLAGTLRMCTAALVLMGLELTLLRGKFSQGLTRQSLLFLVVAGIISGGSSLLFMASVFYAGAAKAAILTATSPLFGLPLSLFVLKERVNRRIVAGTLLAVLGIWLVLGG